MNEITNNNALISVITSSNNIAKKKPSTPDYQPGKFYKGTYQVHSVQTANDLNNLIQGLNSKQSLMLGVPKNDSITGNMVTKKNKEFNPNAIARTKDDITWNPLKEGYLLIDIDDGDVPGMSLDTVHDVRNLLMDYDKSLTNNNLLILPSSSQRYDLNVKSWHVYIGCTGMCQVTVKNYADALQSISWNKGHGAIKISSSGSQLVRQSFDYAVFSAERLALESVFSDNPQTVFYQIDPFIQEGNLKDLTIKLSTNFTRSNKLIEQAKIKSLPEALRIRKEKKEAKIQELLNSGIGTNEAIQIVTTMYDEKKIHEDTIIIFNEEIEGSKKYSAGYVKVNSKKFEGKYCCDPYSIEDGSSKAYILAGGNIYSHKHGGYKITLMASVNLILDKVETLTIPSSASEKKLIVNDIQNLCTSSNISKDEIRDIADTLKTKGLIKRIPEFTVKRDSIYELGADSKLLNTDKNLNTLLDKYSFFISYDEILKEVSVKHVDLNENVDNIIDTSLSIISSFAEREGLPKPIVNDHLNALCLNKYAVNPLKYMIEEAVKEYDGKDYIKEFVDALNINSSDSYKREIITRWGIEAIAAWYHDLNEYVNKDAKLKFENVLVLLGAQGLNKTKLLSELLNFEDYGKYFKEGVKVNPTDKDSVKQAVSAGLVEIGELDASFRKADIADLKAFFSKTNDEVRLPYDRTSSKYKRRTAFAATVNSYYFLVDNTGNRRYWVLELLDIDFKKIVAINMKMLWGQLGRMFLEGKKWWFDDKDVNDRVYLEEINTIHRRHQQTTSMEDYALELVSKIKNTHTGSSAQYSPTKLLKLFGVINPNKVQLNEFKTSLLKYDMKPNGSGMYYIPKVDMDSPQRVSGGYSYPQISC